MIDLLPIILTCIIALILYYFTEKFYLNKLPTAIIPQNTIPPNYYSKPPLNPNYFKTHNKLIMFKNQFGKNDYKIGNNYVYTANGNIKSYISDPNDLKDTTAMFQPVKKEVDDVLKNYPRTDWTYVPQPKRYFYVPRF